MRVQKIYYSFFFSLFCFVGNIVYACGSDWLWESGQANDTVSGVSTTNKDMASDFPGVSYVATIQKIADQVAEKKEIAQTEQKHQIKNQQFSLPKTVSMHDVTELARKKAPERDRASSVQLDQVESLVVDFLKLISCSSEK